MPGPAPQERKHGRTPNSVNREGDWREYPDVPFTGAPAMPRPPGRRKSWHPMAAKMWETASVMPHCVDWRAEEWFALEILVSEVDTYYQTADAKKKTAQLSEIRKQMNALGIGEHGRLLLRIRYKQRVEPGLPGQGPDGTTEIVRSGVQPAGNVLPLRERKKQILGGGQASAG